MNVKLPDGTIVQNVPDDISKADLTAKLSSNGYDVSKLGAAPAPANPNELQPVDHSAIYKSAGDVISNVGTAAKNYGAGLLSKAGAQMAEYGMALPNAVRDISMRQMPGTTSKELAGVAAKAGPALGNPESGFYKAGEGTPEVVESGITTGMAGGALAPKLAPVLGRTAPLAADVAVNAGYEGAKTGAEGGSASDVVKTMALSGLAAGAGHAIGGTAQRGVTPYSSKEAQTLVENGVTPTWGQHLGGAGSAAEEGATYAPVVGGAIGRARDRSLEQYARAETNAALQPLGVTTNKTGRAAVEHAEDLITQSYRSVVDQTHIPALKVQNVVKDTTDDLEHMPLLTDSQLGQVKKYIETKIQPELAYSQNNAMILPGRTAKDIDIELGDISRRYLKSTTSADNELGQAFKQLQTNLRGALEGQTPEAVAKLRNTDKAFRNLLPVKKAMSSAIEEGGQFTPKQLFRAGERTKVDVGDTALNRAGLEVLPTGKTKEVNILKKAVHLATTGTIGTMAPEAAIPLWLGANMAYSRPALSVAARGLPGVNRTFSKLPFTAAQLAARAAANKQGE